MIEARTRSDWQDLANTFAPRLGPYIDGAFIVSDESATFEVRSPATGGHLASLPVGSRGDVDCAVAAARRAIAEGRWSSMSLAARKQVLLETANRIETRACEFAVIEALEIGKAVANARAEIAMSVECLRFFAETIDKAYGLVAPSDGDLLAISCYEPRGVVGAIVPWNFPLANAVMKVAPALAAGNAVVLKPSEVASQSALYLAELMTAAGLPAGMLNVAPGLGHTVGDALARHSDVDFLTFTGSTRTGRMLMTCAGESNGKPLMLECGGKSPQIICADMADEIEGLASRIVHDGFWNQGQWCSARSRVIVEAPIHDRLLEAVIAEAAKLVPGEPLDPATNFGTMASPAQFEQVRQYVELGKHEGARAVLDSAVGRPCALSHGPAIFAGVTPAMRIAREEIFGPVLCVIEASDFEQAIALANDTDYGLSATLWTHDARRAMAGARLLQAGRVAIRTSVAATGSSSIALAAEPWGASGFGVEKGIDGLRAYCRLKAVEIL